MGILIEYLQSFNVHRLAEFADVVANTVGVFIGYILSIRVYKNGLLSVEKFIFNNIKKY
jgi:VanZ family protein